MLQGGLIINSTQTQSCKGAVQFHTQHISLSKTDKLTAVITTTARMGLTGLVEVGLKSQ